MKAFILLSVVVSVCAILKGKRSFDPVHSIITTPVDFIGEIYMGEPFLTQSLSLNELWF